MQENLHHITDELLVKHLLQETNAAEDRQVEDWLNASEPNRAYYTHFTWIWEESKRLAAASSVDEGQAWQRFRQRVENGKKVKKMSPLSWMRIAAAVILIAGSFLLGYTLFGTRVRQLEVATLEKTLTDTLPDGSIVTLNKRSNISYPSAFTGRTRPIALKGEAFFKVTPDKQKPFTIQVNDVSIRVVGTAFNVKEENGNTEVTVQSGIVQVTKNNKMIELRPAEKVTVAAKDSLLNRETVTDKLYNYYESKEFVCDNTPLWKLVDVLNTAYGAHIIIGREEIRQLPLTTTFNNESLETILNIVGATFKISVERTGDQIILK